MLRDLTIVVLHTGREIPVNEVGSNVTAAELLNALSGKLNLPQGTRGVLVRKKTNKQILLAQSLQSAGVESKETLTVDFDRTAGGGIVVRSFRDIQIFDTYFNRDNVSVYHRFAVYAIILYTASDLTLAKFINNNFLELHNLAGGSFAFYIVERPNPSWLAAMRKEFAGEISAHIESIWAEINNSQFSPLDNSSAYEIAKKLGIKWPQLPCIIFFTNLNSKKMIVVPVSSLIDKSLTEAKQEELLALFRRLIDRIIFVAQQKEEDRLKILSKEISRLKITSSMARVEEIILPEIIKDSIGLVVKLLIR
jgi:hypothetical protein